MNLTRWVIVGIVIVGAAIDIYLALNCGIECTISDQLRLVSHKWIIIPFAFGVLAGHVFWSKG